MTSDVRHYLLVCIYFFIFFFFKQKTAYEMRISDWSSDVCSSDLYRQSGLRPHITLGYGRHRFDPVPVAWNWTPRELVLIESHVGHSRHRVLQRWQLPAPAQGAFDFKIGRASCRERVCQYV